MQREIVLDTETTGLDPKGGHRLIEVACVEIVNRFPTGRTFHELIDPERDVPRDAEQVHGISTAMLKGKPVFAGIADPFLEFIGEAPLVIHNAAFDVGFLNAELDRSGRPILGYDRVVDTLQLARRKHPAGPNSLDALCKRYGIDLSGRTKHGALIDCELLAAVYLELTGGHQARLDLAAEGTAAARRGGGGRSRIGPRPSPLPPRLSDDEVAAHRTFVATLKNPLWPTDGD